ncbi:MAG: outer membrane beta-barrel protein [Rhodopila sp.]|nr:outer membrane beta-barrel protein [Rhodopila sp.]
MWARSTLIWWFLVLALAVCLAGRAMAEMMSALFPEGVPGYDTDAGVTVQSRLHPEQQPLGLREGVFRVSPTLDEGMGYTSNVLAGPYRRGSWEILTAPALTFGSDWSRDAFGAMFSVQDTRYLSLPSQNRTDGAASAGGRVDIGEDQLTLAAAHLSQHEDRGRVDTIASDNPIAFKIDDVRASYAMSSGRWSIAPSVQATNWTYAGTTIMGVPASQSYRDRIVVQGAATLRYEWAPLRNILVILRALGQDYTRTPIGQPSPDSGGYQMLAGLNYDDNAVWRWRLLLGGEARRFTSPLYTPRNTFIAEAGAGWSPTGMTTVSATISRDTEDAAQEGVSGLVYTAARLTIDHECLRNLLFKASLGLQQADFFQGGHQSGTTASLGLTWVMNRGMRLSFTYDQADLHGASIPTEALATGYSRGVGLVTLRLGM